MDNIFKYIIIYLISTVIFYFIINTDKIDISLKIALILAFFSPILNEINNKK
jgi:uncharacterized membrane protein